MDILGLDKNNISICNQWQYYIGRRTKAIDGLGLLG